VAETNAEAERLRKEVRKLREYARLSVQDRKILIHKIGTLKDKVNETHAKSLSPARQILPPDTAESAIQCNLLEQKNYWLRFAKLQQRLVSLSESADLLRSQLEVSCDLLEPASVEISATNRNVAATLANVSKSSRDLLRSVSQTINDLKESPPAAPEAPQPSSEAEIEERSVTSLSNDCLPDPAEMDLPENPQDSLVRHLHEEIERRDRDIQHKLTALDALSDQVNLYNNLANPLCTVCAIPYSSQTSGPRPPNFLHA
jgi:hypothetical protein